MARQYVVPPSGIARCDPPRPLDPMTPRQAETEFARLTGCLMAVNARMERDRGLGRQPSKADAAQSTRYAGLMLALVQRGPEGWKYKL